MKNSVLFKRFAFVLMFIGMLSLVSCSCRGCSSGEDTGLLPNEESNTFTITFDANGTNVSNLPDPQKIKDGEFATYPKEPAREDYYLLVNSGFTSINKGRFY